MAAVVRGLPPRRRSERIIERRRKEEETSEKPPPAKKKKKQRHTFTLSGGVQFEIDIKYAPREVLGNGSYGVVCSCVDRETDESVAIKKIPDVFSDESTALRTLREIQILRQIGSHDSIISLKDVMLSPSPTLISSNFRDVYLVQELMEFDLSRVIASSSPAGLSGGHIKYILFQILRGLKFLHSANVIHRDLKPQNILLNKNCDLKICDFGLARTNRQDPQKMTEYVVTRWYRAPELLTGSVWYGPAIDIWSAGCILAEMLGGSPIFPGESSLNQIDKIYEVLGMQLDLSFIQSFNFRKHEAALPYSPGVQFEKVYDCAEPLAVDLLKKMLVLNPWDRISASQALEHPYFSGLYDPDCDGGSPAKLSLVVDEYQRGVDVKMIRDLMWEEMLFYHPEERSQDTQRPVAMKVS